MRRAAATSRGRARKTADRRLGAAFIGIIRTTLGRPVGDLSRLANHGVGPQTPGSPMWHGLGDNSSHKVAHMDRSSCSVALVDGHEDTREELQELLITAGYRLVCFGHWRDAREALTRLAVNAVVLCDWKRGGGRGSHRYLKRAAGNAPFILICDGGVTRWDGRFTAVLYHPVRQADLVRAIVSAVEDASASLTYGGYVLNIKRRTLSYGDISLRTTPVETEVLKVLMLAQGRFVQPLELLARAWGLETLLDRRIVYTHMSWLRHKLGETFGSRELILSERAQGYCFDPTRAPMSAAVQADV